MHSHDIFSSSDFCFHCELHCVFSLKSFSRKSSIYFGKNAEKNEKCLVSFLLGLVCFCFASTCTHIVFQRRYISLESECVCACMMCAPSRWIELLQLAEQRWHQTFAIAITSERMNCAHQHEIESRIHIFCYCLLKENCKYVVKTPSSIFCRTNLNDFCRIGCLAASCIWSLLLFLFRKFCHLRVV